MGRVLAAGCRGAVWRSSLVLLVWAMGALFALAFSLSAGHWLDLALDGSLTTATLLRDLDANVLIELWRYHHESLAQLFVIALLLVLTNVALGIGLNAGLAGTTQDPGVAVLPREFWRRGFALYPVCARLWGLATAIVIALLAAITVTARLLVRWLSESPSEMPYYYIYGTAFVLAGTMLIGLVTVHDHARIYAARRGVGALRAYRWALWFVTRGDARALLLAVTLLLCGGLVWLVYQSLATLLPPTTTFGMNLSLLWGQVFLLARAFLRVATFVAESELQIELPE